MLTLWNPLIPIRERSDSKMSPKNYFDRLFEDSFATMTRDLFSAPWANLGIEHIKNEDGTLTIAVDVPGLKQEDITIEVKDDIVNIKGVRKTKTSSYEVSKSFSIPNNFTSDDVKAELVDGVLSLTLLAKPIPQNDIKKIPISVPSKQIK